MKPLIAVPFIVDFFLLVTSNTVFALTSLEVTEPRQYGYVLGDVFERKLKLKFAKDHSIIIDNKKSIGRINNWLAIRKVGSKKLSSLEHIVEIQYQVVNVPKKPLMVVVPSFEMKTLIGNDQKKIKSEELLVTLAPITPKTVVNRGGLLNIQPNNLIPAIQSDKILLRIFFWLLLLMIPVLILIYTWAPWQKIFFKKKLPFSIAHAKVVKLESTSDLIFWKESLILFHNALNTTAKRTVFVGSLDEFFLVNIKYKKLSKEIRYFLNCSRKLFYENEVLPNTDEKTLFVKLIHKMALIEKRLD